MTAIDTTLPLRLLGHVADMPWWLAWVVTPLVVAWIAGQRSPPRPAQRWVVSVAFWGGMLALSLRLARHGLAHWDIPSAVWVAGAVLLPLLMTGQGPVRARVTLVIWLVCVAGCAAWLSDLWNLASALNGLLFLGTGLACGAGLALRALQPPTPPPSEPSSEPPPSPSPSPLIRHLDSDAAQEGADKYTRE